MSVNEKIKHVRKLRNLRQRQLGEAMELPVSAASIRVCEYEAGTRTPNQDKRNKIAKFCDISPKYLCDDETEDLAVVLMYLFELERHYDLYPSYDKKTNTVSLKLDADHPLTDVMKDWALKREEYLAGKLDEKEYDLFKMSYPSKSSLNVNFDDIKAAIEDYKNNK